MPLMRARRRAVALKQPIPGREGSAFEPVGEIVEADVQPMNGSAAAQMYGLKPEELRLMLFAPGARVARGMGVCVDAEHGAEPDFRVIYAAQWQTHGVAHLRLIPPSERGTGR